jgi:hypothetical protein
MKDFKMRISIRLAVSFGICIVSANSWSAISKVPAIPVGANGSGAGKLNNVAKSTPIKAAAVIPEAAVIFRKVTGFNLTSRIAAKPEFNESFKTLGAEKFAEALTQSRMFESTKLMSFVSKFGERETEPSFNVLDDIQTTLLGLIANDQDFRKSLTGGSLFEFSGQVATASMFPLKSTLSSGYNNNTQDHQGGIQNARRFALLNYTGGTNRRQIKYIFDKFLCTPIDRWKNPLIDDYFVRMDIDRAPGGVKATFQSKCRSCHAPMDAFAGAAAMDDDSGRQNSNPVPKTHNRLQSNFDNHVRGNIPDSDYWMNLLTTEKEKKYFGWRGPETGFGIHSFGEAIANSNRFDDCMVQRVNEEMCENPLSQQESDRLAQEFRKSNFNLRLLFAKVALSKECK